MRRGGVSPPPNRHWPADRPRAADAPGRGNPAPTVRAVRGGGSVVQARDGIYGRLQGLPPSAPHVPPEPAGSPRGEYWARDMLPFASPGTETRVENRQALRVRLILSRYDRQRGPNRG